MKKKNILKNLLSKENAETEEVFACYRTCNEATRISCNRDLLLQTIFGDQTFCFINDPLLWF